MKDDVSCFSFVNAIHRVKVDQYQMNYLMPFYVALELQFILKPYILVSFVMHVKVFTEWCWVSVFASSCVYVCRLLDGILLV